MIISTQYNSNKFVNGYLLVLFLFLSSRFFVAGYNEINPVSLLTAKASDYSPFLVVIFPCVYLYFNKLKDNQKKFKRKELKHFLIPLSLGFTNIFTSQSSVSLSYIFHVTFSLIALYYVYLSYIVLKKEIWVTDFKIGVIEKQNVLLKNWTILIFIICLLAVLRLLICLVIDLFVGYQSYGGHYLWITAIFSCILFFKILLTPEILYGYHLLQDKIKEKRKAEFVFGEFWIDVKNINITNIQDLRLKEKIDEQISVYIQDIEITAFEENWFRNPSVSLGDFAAKLGLPKSHLTYVFKYHSKISFIDFKKRLRIYDSVRLIENEFLKSNTLESLAKEVGFASYNPFFTSFKEIVGVVPQDFTRQNKQV
jgi:AraC-like DNA-binding protein